MYLQTNSEVSSWFSGKCSGILVSRIFWCSVFRVPECLSDDPGNDVSMFGLNVRIECLD